MQTDTNIAENTDFDVAIVTAENTPAKGQHIQSFNYGGGRFETSDLGVWFVGSDDDGNDKKPLFICSRLDVIGLTSGIDGSNWGRMIEFVDPKGRTKRLAVSATMWQGDGLRLREMLADQGLIISSNGVSRKLLMDFLATAPTITQFESVDRLGWHGSAFVLPNKVLSSDQLDNFVYQSSNPAPPYAQSGSVDDWRKNVAYYARGNSRLLFAISVAFAAPMMHLAGFRTSTGFHIRGSSSSGKSTAMEAAVSVYGKPEEFMRTWRSTANGLEGTALAHNDGMLALDELSQINPKDLDTVVYMIGNGQKKGRATVTGNTKPISTWRLLYLSNGEESLSGMLSKTGIKTNAGQEMRFIDIEADAGKGFGVFDHCHGLDGGVLSKTIKANTSDYYGSVGIEWLSHLVKNKAESELRTAIDTFTKNVLPSNATSQHKRVCDYFGLVAVAGEMATDNKLTGWQEGEVWQSCKRLFLEWMELFGTGNKEQANIINQLKAFIESHGASRFESALSDGNERIINRVGFVRIGDNDVEYLLFAQSFKNEIMVGLDHRLALKTLIDAEILTPAPNGQPSTLISVKGEKHKLYRIKSEKLFGYC